MEIHPKRLKFTLNLNSLIFLYRNAKNIPLYVFVCDQNRIKSINRKEYRVKVAEYSWSHKIYYLYILAIRIYLNIYELIWLLNHKTYIRRIICVLDITLSNRMILIFHRNIYIHIYEKLSFCDVLYCVPQSYFAGYMNVYWNVWAIWH